MGNSNNFGPAWASGVGAENATVQGIPLGDVNLNGDVDDVGFLTAVLDSVEAMYNVDTDSVFFVGYSMGGFMANKMGIVLSDRVAGVASVSGTIGYWEMNKTPTANVNTIHFHGTEDELIRYNDGWLVYFMPIAKVATGAQETVDFWRNYNQCDNEPTITYFPNISNDAFQFERYLYTNGNNDSRSAFVRVIGGEHAWYTTPYNDIDYATEIYKFFTNTMDYPEVTGIAEQANAQVAVFPNPTVDKLQVQAEGYNVVEILNFVGQVVYRANLTETTTQINVSDFPSGVYFVRLAGENVVTRKITKL